MNKTQEWLKSLGNEEKEKLLKECRADGRKFRETFKLRCKEIQEHRRRILAEKAAEAERKDVKAKKKKEDIVKNILYYGLWQSKESIDEAIGTLKSKKEKREAVMWQLKFRKVIFEQKHNDKTIYNFSRKGSNNKHIDLTVGELTENLIKLLEDSMKRPTTENQQRGVPLLVGKKIEHTFTDDTFTGRVISVVPGYPDWYNVVYDDDAAVYTYKLLDDYKNNDLKIIRRYWNRVGFFLLLKAWCSVP